MATSSFQKNFTVTKKQSENVVSVMTCTSTGALMSKDFDSKFEKVINHRELLSKIFTEK